MMCSAYFGELSEVRKVNWNNGEGNPYAVLESPICLERKGHELLKLGNECFHDRIQIDCSSFGWKCNPEEVIQFLIDHKSTLPWLIKSDEETIENVRNYISERGEVSYGVVFVEEV